MAQLQMSDDEYDSLMERIYKILNRTEQLDQVTHHMIWDVWRMLYFSKVTKQPQ